MDVHGERGAEGRCGGDNNGILQAAGKDFGRKAPFLHPAPAVTDGGSGSFADMISGNLLCDRCGVNIVIIMREHYIGVKKCFYFCGE